MPALAMMVISFSSMPLSFSQYASVPATSRKGSPEEKPKKNIVHAAGCVNAAHTDGLAGLASTTTAVIGHLRQGVVDDEGRVVGEARLRMDRARTQPVAQRRRHDLVIDAPADVLGARRAAVAPPGVILAFGMQRAIRVDPAAVVGADGH